MASLKAVFPTAARVSLAAEEINIGKEEKFVYIILADLISIRCSEF